MANRIASAALQFSKWLSKMITWFWIIYRTIAVVISGIVPTAAPSIAATVTGVDTIMMINVSTYLINSLGEKYIYSDRFVLSWIKHGGWKSFMNKVSGLGDDSDEEGEG